MVKLFTSAWIGFAPYPGFDFWVLTLTPRFSPPQFPVPLVHENESRTFGGQFDREHIRCYLTRRAAALIVLQWNTSAQNLQHCFFVSPNSPRFRFGVIFVSFFLGGLWQEKKVNTRHGVLHDLPGKKSRQETDALALVLPKLRCARARQPPVETVLLVFAVLAS